jgi:hypothetical protein
VRIEMRIDVEVNPYSSRPEDSIATGRSLLQWQRRDRNDRDDGAKNTFFGSPLVFKDPGGGVYVFRAEDEERLFL